MSFVGGYRLGESFQENPGQEGVRNIRDRKKPNKSIISGELPGSGRSLIPWGTREHELHLRVFLPLEAKNWTLVVPHQSVTGYGLL